MFRAAERASATTLLCSSGDQSSSAVPNPVSPLTGERRYEVREKVVSVLTGAIQLLDEDLDIDEWGEDI